MCYFTPRNVQCVCGVRVSVNAFFIFYFRHSKHQQFIDGHFTSLYSIRFAFVLRMNSPMQKYGNILRATESRERGPERKRKVKLNYIFTSYLPGKLYVLRYELSFFKVQQHNWLLFEAQRFGSWQLFFFTRFFPQCVTLTDRPDTKRDQMYFIHINCMR